jgi:hypothetical protein
MAQELKCGPKIEFVAVNQETVLQNLEIGRGVLFGKQKPCLKSGKSRKVIHFLKL